ncbi:MAG: NAD(P)-dependent oxidoreductase [Elusimicrobia bacterium]|nr:NAD(P)-dependent oxidoreductase [Elusimicrobiota bacterium]
MNILITGATGFIGKALVRRLAAGKNRVAVLVRDQGKAAASLPAGSEIYAADITDKAALAELAPSIGSVDMVIHLAACINYNAGKETLFKTNVEGTDNVLRLAGKLGAKRFIYISSIEAIGPVSGKDVPAGETQLCCPVNLYGESKLEAEKLVLRGGAELKMETFILRLGNVYGPESLSFVRPIAEAMLSSNKAWLYLNWNLYQWHPVYIDDAVAGIISAAVKNNHGGIYNITGEDPATVGRLAEVIMRELAVDLKARRVVGWGGIYIRLSEMWSKFKALFRFNKYSRVNWVYSIEKARRELGYAPQVSLEDGIHRTIEWARKEGILLKRVN